MKGRRLRWVLLLTGILIGACDSALGPAAPSPPQSFLAGTWRGTVAIQVNPDVVDAPPASTGSTSWTFEVVPQTNQQTFKASIRSDHPWLPIATIGSTALAPGSTPPTQISTQGDYDSPRGCRGTFGSFGTADASRIDADFTGVDCSHITFTGRVTLTKQ
jgi:hypothetical protein